MTKWFANLLVSLLVSLSVTTFALNGTMPIPAATNFLFLAYDTCPAGWVQDTSHDGKFLRLTIAAHADVGSTGGSDSLTPSGTNSAPSFTGNSVTSSSTSGGTPAGSNSAPTFTGDSVSTSSDSAGTPVGTVSAPTFTGTNNITTSSTSGGTPSGTVSQPTFTGNSVASSATSAGTPAGTNSTGTVTPTGTVAFPTAPPIVTVAPVTQVISHTHASTGTLTVQGGTTAATTGTHVMTSTATGGSGRLVTSGDAVAVTTPAPTGAVTSFVPTASVTWPIIPAKYGAAVAGSGLSGTTAATSAFLQKTVAGHAIIGAVSFNNVSSQTLNSVTDTEGNTYTLLSTGLTPDTTNHVQLEMFYTYNITGGTKSNILTAHFSASSVSVALMAMEVAGLTTTDPIDKSGYQTQSSTATPTAPSAAVTPTTNGQFLFGVANNTGAGGGTTTATGAWNGDEQTGVYWLFLEQQVQPTAAAVQATFSYTLTQAFVSGIATFKAAAASVPTFSGSSSTTSAETFTGSALGTHTHTTTATGTVTQPTFTGDALSSHTHTLTPTGTNSAPTFSGSALSSHGHTVTATGTNSAPTFTGSALGGHTHTTTATGSVSAPTFTGDSADNRPAFVNVIPCKPGSMPTPTHEAGFGLLGLAGLVALVTRRRTHDTAA